jgi:hypothetical protein
MTAFATSLVHATYAGAVVCARACLSSAILAQFGQLPPQLVSAIIEYNPHACVDGRTHTPHSAEVRFLGPPALALLTRANEAVARRCAA